MNKKVMFQVKKHNKHKNNVCSFQNSNKKRKSKKKSAVANDEFNHSALLTAYIIWECSGSTYLTTTKKRCVKEIFKIMEEKVRKIDLISTLKIPNIKLEILHKVSKRDQNKLDQVMKTARNIYYNLCQNKSLQQQFKDIFSCLHRKTEFINLTNMLGMKSFESRHESCIKCSTQLTKVDRYKGKICVSYTLHHGPQIGRSFLKKCSKCNMIYSYGCTETINSKLRNKLKDLEYFESSPFTYFEKELFESTQFHLFENHRGFEKKVAGYNFDHRHTINAIKQRLELNGETLGVRLGTNCKLETNRLIDAFYLYTLQKELEEQCNIQLSISKYEEKQLKNKKQERIDLHRKTSKTLSQSLSQEEKKGIGKADTFLEHVDIFEYYYNKHQQNLKRIDSGIMNLVPVDSEGEVCIGHFIVMMDGNAKNVRSCCSYHEEDAFQGMKFHVIN